MATVKGVNRTLADNPVGSNIMAPGISAGKLRVMTDSYEAVTVASGTIIEMGDFLPKGAKIVEVCLMADALGGSSTLKVGDYEDDDRYIEVSSTWNTANQVQRLNAIAGRHYVVDETTPGAVTTDRQVIITTGGATISGTITLTITYTIE